VTSISPATRRPGVHPALFWFGVAGGTTAWVLHLLVGYWVIEAACPVDSLAVFLTVLTVALAAVAAAAAYASWWALRRLAQRSAGSPGGRPAAREGAEATRPRRGTSLLILLGIAALARPRSATRKPAEPRQQEPDTAGAWDPVPGPARNRLLLVCGCYLNLLSVGMIALAAAPVLALGPCW
jgi:hypothetical protein